MPLRIGMLGMWHVHATGMVRQIVEHPDEFELVGCFDPEPEVVAGRIRDWQPFLGTLPLCASAEELLCRPLDAVLVEGRVSDNVRWASMAVESGFPVLLEKPAGDNVRDFETLAGKCQARGLHLQLVYLFRSMSAVQEMFARAKSGELGQLYEFRGRLPKDRGDYARNEQEVGMYSGGIFFEMAGHLIDFMVTLLGEPRKIHSILRHHDPRPGSFIDNGAALFEFDQAIGIAEVPALEVAAECRRIELYGTEGAAIIPNLGSGHLANGAVQPIDLYSKANGWRRLSPLAATLQIADLREFAAVLAGKKRPDYSIEHDLIVQRALIEATRET